MSDSNWVRTRIADAQVDIDAAVTVDTLDHAAVAVNECAVITNIIAYDLTSNITSIEFYLENNDATQYLIHRALVTAINQTVEWTGKIVLEAGDHIAVVFNGTVAGDDIHSVILGYNVPQFKAVTPAVW
ncbi:MAG: hypothetical protein KAX16_04200 [Actinomycetia bacterium]|nr:hypothetical protein [Actinomycetes bacterium]